MNIEELKEIVEHFDKNCVLVIGDLMLDKFINGTVSRISPEAPVPVVDVISESFRLLAHPTVFEIISGYYKALSDH